MPPEEKALVEQWARNEPAGEVLYPGCNLVTCAFLTQSGVFDDLTIVGGLDLCCGEVFYRFGLHDLTKRFAERLGERFGGKPIERLIIGCPAGYNMFRNMLPQKFGVKLDFPIVFYVDYLRERLASGKLRVVKPLSGRVLVHDSCHGRLVGASLMDSVRALLTDLGLTVVEPPHSREDGYCCGIAAAAPRQSVGDLTKAVGLAHAEYFTTPAEKIVAYCTGCYLVLAAVPAAMPLAKPVRHVLDLVAEAIGRPVPDRISGRTRRLLLGIGRRALPKYLSRDRFWID
jgi:Fe-S oxidoreductase